MKTLIERKTGKRYYFKVNNEGYVRKVYARNVQNTVKKRSVQPQQGFYNPFSFRF